jgi:hypothetical protein
LIQSSPVKPYSTTSLQPHQIHQQLYGKRSYDEAIIHSSPIQPFANNNGHLTPQSLYSNKLRKFNQLLSSPAFSSHVQSSPVPPRTPSPKRQEHEGADLLMYLATSPSPAQRTSFHLNQYPSSSPFVPPRSTPRTPKVVDNRHIGSITPIQHQGSFNFSDYLNILTPSPATKYPAQFISEQRSGRKLNFD